MLKNEGEAMAVCPSEVTQTPEQVRVFKANDPSSSFSSGLKRCVVKPLISSSSAAVGKYTPENSSLDEKRVLVVTGMHMEEPPPATTSRASVGQTEQLERFLVGLMMDPCG